MAKCEKREIPQPPVEYVLTLSEREAMALRRLIRYSIWPSMDNGLIDAIRDSIEAAGVLL